MTLWKELHTGLTLARNQTEDGDQLTDGNVSEGTRSHECKQSQYINVRAMIVRQHH